MDSNGAVDQAIANTVAQERQYNSVSIGLT